MSEHRATIHWQNNKSDFQYKTYDRNHTIRFPTGEELTASAAAAFLGDAGKVNPEDLYVAAISSCHMLTFLAIATRKKLNVSSYQDDAVGVLGKRADGKQAITKVTLSPRVEFLGAPVSHEDLQAMHHEAHGLCFIANSVTCEFEILV